MAPGSVRLMSMVGGADVGVEHRDARPGIAAGEELDSFLAGGHDQIAASVPVLLAEPAAELVGHVRVGTGG